MKNKQRIADLEKRLEQLENRISTLELKYNTYPFVPAIIQPTYTIPYTGDTIPNTWTISCDQTHDSNTAWHQSGTQVAKNDTLYH